MPNNLISIQTPVVDAMEMCGIENDKDRMVFTRWAYQAEKEIGSRYQFIKKIAVININGCAACLPNDAAYVQRALLGDFGCDCTDLFYKWCGATVVTEGVFSSPVGPTFLIVDAGSTDVNFNAAVPIDFEIQDNKIVLKIPRDGQKLTVQYLGYKTDCDGFREISENHVLAITAYICWKYYMRKKRPSNEDFSKKNDWRNEWIREVGNAAAQDSVLTEGQRNNIVSMLHDPYCGIGIPLSSVSSYGGAYW